MVATHFIRNIPEINRVDAENGFWAMNSREEGSGIGDCRTLGVNA
jgi:hypothetical protein